MHQSFAIQLKRQASNQTFKSTLFSSKYMMKQFIECLQTGTDIYSTKDIPMNCKISHKEANVLTDVGDVFEMSYKLSMHYR